ncbi:MAG: MtrB/PioB family decaheme-associated outer membrane protein [Desulfobulbaceae bacterium]|nr:MtrB/PioB family decaheme-associated outer membrane protein [Desulfobulbaceae bacterium]
MKRRYISLIAAALLITPAYAMAADEAAVNGSVELGVRGVDDQDNSAKFQEYRDLDDGLIGNFLLDAYKGPYYFELQGDNIGLDDQDYWLKGGQYGKFKYKLNYDETPHNYSFDAKTFYSGVGTDTLSFSGAAPAPEANWNSFDYSIERKKYGGELEVSLGTPFFVKIGASRLETEGVKPLAGGDFGGTVEMPEPVDYQTNDLNLMAGYRSKTMNFTLTGLLSSFDNNNLYLNWENPFALATETSILPPENDYGKIGANLTMRELPFMSTFSLNGSYAKLEDDFSISDLTLTAPLALNQSTFDGEVIYTNLAAVLVSQPTRELDSRLYYRYADKENNSDIISYDNGLGTIESNATDLFDYSKDDAGIDLGYKLPWQSKAEIGYEYQYVDRHNRPDAANNTDNTVFLQLKNSLSEYVTAKLKYSHLERDTDTDFDLTGVTDTDAEYIAQFVQRYDATDKSRDEIKLSLEFYPLDTLDLGLDYSYIMNDYDEVVLGRTEDTRHHVYLDFLWHHFNFLNLGGFAGYETTDADADHYNFAAGSGVPPQLADPTVDDGNPSSYLWNQEIEDNFWTYGLSSQIRLLEDALKLVLSWEYQKSNGKSTFSSQGATPLLDLDAYDDYSKKRLEAKIVYAFSKQLDINLGYVFEKYTYKDLQYEGYDYTPNASTYLTGAYADYDYEANIAYLTVRYGF